jgi:hypothetical protein
VAAVGRPPTVDMYPGKVFGRLTIVRKAHLKAGLRWWVRCSCGKEFYTKTQYLTRRPNPQISCGCHVNESANPFPREKGIWNMMHRRTEHSDHVSYKDYGGRGILGTNLIRRMVSLVNAGGLQPPNRRTINGDTTRCPNDQGYSLDSKGRDRLV